MRRSRVALILAGFALDVGSELQRIIDRAGLTAAPADLHPLAYRDRHGCVKLPLEATVELARAFAAAEPTTVIG